MASSQNIIAILNGKYYHQQHHNQSLCSADGGTLDIFIFGDFAHNFYTHLAKLYTIIFLKFYFFSFSSTNLTNDDDGGREEEEHSVVQ